MTKTKIALAAVLFAATSSAALAQGYYDPNLANRYPGYAEPNSYGYSSSGKLGNVALRAGEHAAVGAGAPAQARQCPLAGRAGVATVALPTGGGMRTTGSQSSSPIGRRPRMRAATNNRLNRRSSLRRFTLNSRRPRRLFSSSSHATVMRTDPLMACC